MLWLNFLQHRQIRGRHHAPLAGKSAFHLKISKHLHEQLANISLDPDEILVSFDVTSLFTVTPINESLDIIKKLLEEDDTLYKRSNLGPEHIITLLSFCLKTTYFLYNGCSTSKMRGLLWGVPSPP